MHGQRGVRGAVDDLDGHLVYKAGITVRARRIDGVDVTAVRGVDTRTNHRIENAIEQHIKSHYRCTGDRQLTQEFALDLDHNMPAQLDDLMPELLDARRAEAILRAASGAGSGSSPDDHLSAICPKMGRPEITPPLRDFLGEVELNYLLEIRNGAIRFFDVKLVRGSADPAINRAFVESVAAMIHDTPQCEGTHLLEQSITIRAERRQ